MSRVMLCKKSHSWWRPYVLATLAMMDTEACHLSIFYSNYQA